MGTSCGFFQSRRDLDFDGGAARLAAARSGRVYAEYVNVNGAIGAVISSRLATMHELDTIYGTEDLYDFLEIIVTDSHNEAEAARPED